MESFVDSEPSMPQLPSSASLLDHFSALSDPRQRWRVLYPLPEILLCKSLDLIHRSVSDSAIHLTASIIGEAGSILSRMRSTGFAGASGARVLDRIDPLATLAAKR
jgi:hypothetical protein